MTTGPQSFYLFDFDKNIMKVQVPLILTNTKDGTTKELSGKDYGAIKDQIGKEGEWKDWSDDNLFQNYRDVPDVPAEEQSFPKQIRNAIQGDPKSWQAPAWGMFVHACNAQRPFSMITARGHSDETVKAAFQVLQEAGYIEQTPNYFTIYNVTYPPTVKALGDKDGTMEVDELKRIAILKTVDLAIERYGDEPHHFGMSDDTMDNVEAAADAMVTCKVKYPDMRFFVIATNYSHHWKAEVFPANVPVEGHGDPDGPEPIGA